MRLTHFEDISLADETGEESKYADRVRAVEDVLLQGEIESLYLVLDLPRVFGSPFPRHVLQPVASIRKYLRIATISRSKDLEPWVFGPCFRDCGELRGALFFLERDLA